ncbi:bacteriocin-like protein [Aquimarina sp. MAR_2010_214]|uniref:hypothetical protein n=1 Tax=Aquimarina sp. MAR_2010_214 TaxID=1250026 RepID=UPI000CC53C41|nr:hypothetical protein [Aquimarina sp. MAR_2010_214]PKV48813.1 bacteriocin-like protein [Aquimarina sp. MAR_2010_214]
MKNINSIKTLNKNQLESVKGGSSPHRARGESFSLLKNLDDLVITYFSGHGVGDGTGE